jgi:hypothetical protein
MLFLASLVMSELIPV